MKKSAFLAQMKERHPVGNRIVNPSVVMNLKEMDGVPLSAFSTTDIRPCCRTIEKQEPGQGRVSELGDLGENYAENIARKSEKAARVGKKGVFGSCQNRFFRGVGYSYAPPTDFNYDPAMIGSFNATAIKKQR